VFRSKSETDGKTYENYSEITYFYVSADVTISQAAYTDTDTDTDGEAKGGGFDTYNFKYSAINLPLKKGWNLVQEDGQTTVSGTTVNVAYSAKIADKDVPWFYTLNH
jgi:hypothetical protein